MSSQFWLVRACPKAWRDAHTNLFLSVNKKVVGKRKALDETQEDFTLMSKSWVYGFVRWMRLWKKMGFIPAQPYEVSPFWGSARPLGRWGNVPNIWCSWLVQIDSLPFPVLLWTAELTLLGLLLSSGFQLGLVGALPVQWVGAERDQVTTTPVPSTSLDGVFPSCETICVLHWWDGFLSTSARLEPSLK